MRYYVSNHVQVRDSRAQGKLLYTGETRPDAEAMATRLNEVLVCPVCQGDKPDAPIACPLCGVLCCDTCVPDAGTACPDCQGRIPAPDVPQRPRIGRLSEGLTKEAAAELRALMTYIYELERRLGV